MINVCNIFHIIKFGSSMFYCFLIFLDLEADFLVKDLEPSLELKSLMVVDFAKCSLLRKVPPAELRDISSKLSDGSSFSKTLLFV